jgi:hypothetical protein
MCRPDSVAAFLFLFRDIERCPFFFAGHAARATLSVRAMPFTIPGTIAI